MRDFGVKCGLFFVGLALIVHLMMAMINVLAGCESWNKETWNKNSRCYSISDILSGNTR